jgi:hypothetical protein
MLKRPVLMVAAFAWILSAQPGAPLRLHPRNPHYFLYDGHAIALVTSGEHYGSVINKAFDYRRYLDTLSASGLNYTRIFAGSYTELPERSFGILRNTLAPTSGNLISPWMTDPDGRVNLSEWNPAWTSRLHDFLSEAQKRSIIVEISLFSSTYQPQHWAISPFNPARNTNGTTLDDWKKLHTLDNGNILAHQERYVRHVVREANGFPNVFFEIQNEPWSDRPTLTATINPYLQAPARDRYPNSIDLPDTASLDWQKRVASWIDSEEATLPNRHLIAQNCCNFGYPVRQTDLAPQASIINFHYAYPDAASANRGLPVVLGYDETGFMARNSPSGTAEPDAAYLRQAWNFMLSGGGLFDSLDYSFTVGHEDGSDTAPNGPGGGSPQLRRGLQALGAFLRALPLEGMSPDFSFVTHASGAYARALSGSGTYAVYLDGARGPSQVSLRLPPGNYSLQWIDPAGGTSPQPDRNLRVSNREPVLIYSPPFSQGIALRITHK